MTGRFLPSLVLASLVLGSVLGFVLGPVPSSLAGPAGATGAAFVEEFDALDPARWFVSDGWNNGDHQNCDWSADRVEVADGALRLSFAADPTPDRQYRCGELQSRALYGPGTFEVRMRAPAGSGMVAAFFTYGGPPHGPTHDEIDVELLLKDPSGVQFNTYREGQGGNERVVSLSPPADAAFHDYAFVWEPDRVTFFVDGEQRHRIEGPGAVPAKPGKIFLSLWGSDTLGSWLDPFEAPPFPLTMEVERVLFTPLGEPCPDTATACAPADRANDATNGAKR